MRPFLTKCRKAHLRKGIYHSVRVSQFLQPRTRINDLERILTYHTIDTTKTTEVVLTKISQPNRFQEVLLPASSAPVDAYWHETLLAGHTAEAAVLVAGRHVRESIRQVVEFETSELFRLHVVLQP